MNPDRPTAPLVFGPDGRPAEDPRAVAARDVAKALEAYAHANGTTARGALLQLALHNRLYEPDTLARYDAPPVIVRALRKGLKLEAQRAARRSSGRPS